MYGLETIKTIGTTIEVAHSGSWEDVTAASHSAPDILAIPPWKGVINKTIIIPSCTSIYANRDTVFWQKGNDKHGFENPILKVLADSDRRNPVWNINGINMVGTGFKNGHPDIGLLVLGDVLLHVNDVTTAKFGRSGVSLRGDGRGECRPGQPRGTVSYYVADDMGYVDGRLRLGYGIENIGYYDGQDVWLEVRDSSGHNCRHFYTQGNHARGVVERCDIHNQPENSHAIDAHGATKHWASSYYLIARNNRLHSGRSHAGIVIRGGFGRMDNNQCNMDVQTPYLATNEQSNQSPQFPKSDPAEVWGWDNYYKSERVGLTARNDAIVHDYPPDV